MMIDAKIKKYMGRVVLGTEGDRCEFKLLQLHSRSSIGGVCYLSIGKDFFNGFVILFSLFFDSICLLTWGVLFVE